MKKLNLLLSVLFACVVFAPKVSAQGASSNIFYENFDSPSNFKMYTSSTSGLNDWGLHWVNVTPPYSDSGRVAFKDTIYLMTDTLDISGFRSVSIEFDHVAKISEFDDAYIQISLDSQKTWITLTDVEQQSGAALQSRTGSNVKYLFNEISGLGRGNVWNYPLGGGTTNPNIYWSPTSSSDFIHEVFEISNHLDNSTNNLTVRFVLGDNLNERQNASNPNDDRVGWFIDNVEVNGATCLQIAPEIDLDPPSNYINQYIGSVYWQGPYDFTAEVTDAEGVDSVRLYYSVNGGPEQLIDFTHLNGATYYAAIPASAVNLLDKVCWRIEAIDVTDCSNKQIYPNSSVGCHEFEVRRDLPKGCSTTPVNQYPYKEDFDAPECVVGTSSNLCKEWTNATGDFSDWYVHMGNTPTSGTGPVSDYPGGEKYLYLESSGFANATANIKSPCLDFYEIENPNVRFYVNTYGQSTGSLHVDLLTFEGPKILDVIPPIPTSSNPDWRQVEFNLYKYRDKIVQLRIRGVTGFNDLSDIAFDSVSIFNSPLVDISAISVSVDELAPASTQDSVTVGVRNLGVFPVDSFNIYLSYNRQAFSSPVFVDNVTINPSETKYFKVKSNLQVPLGEYQIQAVVKLFENATEGDARVYNDTTEITTGRGLPRIDLSSNPYYFDSFEDTVKLWTAFPFNNFNTNRWQHGYPNFGQTTGAYDGNFAWDINLDIANTNIEETAFLISPFMNLEAGANLLLQFQQNRNINETDLFYVQYSRDRGETWHFFTAQDIFAKNWASATEILPTSELAVGWDSTSMSLTPTDGQRDLWKLSEYDASILADPTEGPINEVLLRFGFYDQAVESDGGGDGVSIDAVKIMDMFDSDAAPIEIQRPFSNCLLSKEEEVTILVENYSGLQSIKHLPVKVNVYKDGQAGVDQSFTEIIPSVDMQPRDTFLYTLTNKVDLSTVGQWYTIEVITQYEGADVANAIPDQNPINDTLRKRVENIDGCYMRLELVQNGVFRLYGHYQFYFDGKIPEYPSYMHFRSSFDTPIKVCARDSSEVLFELYDPYPTVPPNNLQNIATYSIFNNLIDEPIVEDRNNTPLVNMRPGSQTQYFVMDCPPVRSTVVNNSSLKVISQSTNQSTSDILPTGRNYNFELTWRNMGIEKIGYVEMQIWVDENKMDVDTVIFPVTDSLPYSKYYKHIFSDIFVGPGSHTIMAVMDNPNQLLDEEPWDDTARIQLNVVDTSYVDLDSLGYGSSFETDARPQWVSMNPYTYTTNSLFEKGTPSKNFLNRAYDGKNAWVTDLDDLYRSFDSSSVVSPYFLFEKDVCYNISFYHSFNFADHAQDGGNFQYTIDTGKTWITITDPSNPDSASSPFFTNWNNVYHIAAIPNNDAQDPSSPWSYYNSGWSGISDSTGNYIRSSAPLGFYKDQYVVFRFNFESDGSPNGEGWAVDSFAIDTTNSGACFTVGMEELLAKNAFALGNNKPNPFNDQTLIPIYLPKSGEVTVEVLNLLGQPIYRMTERKAMGDHLIPIQSDDWSSGLYYYSVTFDGQKQTKKMMVTK